MGAEVSKKEKCWDSVLLGLRVFFSSQGIYEDSPKDKSQDQEACISAISIGCSCQHLFTWKEES
jgi:hypothetical protein